MQVVVTHLVEGVIGGLVTAVAGKGLAIDTLDVEGTVIHVGTRGASLYPVTVKWICEHGQKTCD